MNGYQYLVRRNRLIFELEDAVHKLSDLLEPERVAGTRKLEAQFDLRLRQLYTEVAGEYPGERKIKARPIDDPR
jgi:hypothetical protein